MASNLGLYCLKIRIKILIFNLPDVMRTMVAALILYEAFHHSIKVETVPRLQNILLVPFTKLISRPRDCGSEPHRSHCGVSLSKTH